MGWSVLDFVKFGSVCIILGSAWTFVYIFILAFQNGYRLTITINEYFEAFPELAIILWGIPLGTYFIIKALVDQVGNQ